MSFTKAKIYNLSLSALLLSREVSNVETDKSNEVRVLNTHFDIAFESTLQDMDLDGTSSPITLELLADLSDTEEPWTYVYKYPNDAVFFRRIVSGQVTDNKSTHISKRVGLYQGQKSIFTNEPQAIGEFISKTIPLSALNPMAGMAVAYKLAVLSAPLIVGKGAKTLRDGLMDLYKIAKHEAQETDVLENFNYESDYLRSEFVRARIS